MTRATSSSAPDATYTYDGNLKRVKSVEGGKTFYTVYSQSGALLHRDDKARNEATDYVSAGGEAVARVTKKSSGARDVLFVHTDHLGSPTVMTNVSGLLFWRDSYKPFGDAKSSGPLNKNNRGFTGHIADASTGLVYMQARHYDPLIGRFYSIDPVGWTGATPSFNRYAYVANDPVNGWDPTGMEIVAELRTYELGEVATVNWNHSYVVIRDTETGEVFYVRAGPSGEIANAGAAASSGTDVVGPNGEKIYVRAVTGARARRAECYNNPSSNCRGRRDRNRVVRTTYLDESTTMNDAKQSARRFAAQTNRSRRRYNPRRSNSNTFAAGLMDELDDREARYPSYGGHPGSSKEDKERFERGFDDREDRD